jgi:hypothetical protein
MEASSWKQHHCQDARVASSSCLDIPFQHFNFAPQNRHFWGCIGNPSALAMCSYTTACVGWAPRDHYRPENQTMPRELTNFGYSKFHFSITRGTGLRPLHLVHAQGLATNKASAPNLQENLGLQICTSLAALCAVHQRHDQLAYNYAVGFMKWLDLERNAPRSYLLQS